MHGTGRVNGPSTYPTIMKLGTVMSHLKKTQKMYNSRNTSLKSAYFHLKFEIFATSGKRDKNCILIHFL